MKRLTVGLCIVILAVMTLFSACGKKGQSGEDAELAGTYVMVEMISNGRDISEELESSSVTLTVSEDHATFQYMEITHVWSVDTDAQTMSTDDGTKVPYRLEDGRLIVEQDGGNNKMVFKKQEEVTED